MDSDEFLPLTGYEDIMLARYLAGTDFEDFTDITPYECLIDESSQGWSHRFNAERLLDRYDKHRDQFDALIEAIREGCSDMKELKKFVDREDMDSDQSSSHRNSSPDCIDELDELPSTQEDDLQLNSSTREATPGESRGCPSSPNSRYQHTPTNSPRHRGLQGSYVTGEGNTDGENTSSRHHSPSNPPRDFPVSPANLLSDGARPSSPPSHLDSIEDSFILNLETSLPTAALSEHSRLRPLFLPSTPTPEVHDTFRPNTTSGSRSGSISSAVVSNSRKRRSAATPSFPSCSPHVSQFSAATSRVQSADLQDKNSISSPSPVLSYVSPSPSNMGQDQRVSVEDHQTQTPLSPSTSSVQRHRRPIHNQASGLDQVFSPTKLAGRYAPYAQMRSSALATSPFGSNHSEPSPSVIRALMGHRTLSGTQENQVDSSIRTESGVYGISSNSWATGPWPPKRGWRSSGRISSEGEGNIGHVLNRTLSDAELAQIHVQTRLASEKAATSSGIGTLVTHEQTTRKTAESPESRSAAVPRTRSRKSVTWNPSTQSNENQPPAHQRQDQISNIDQTVPRKPRRRSSAVPPIEDIPSTRSVLFPHYPKIDLEALIRRHSSTGVKPPFMFNNSSSSRRSSNASTQPVSPSESRSSSASPKSVRKQTKRRRSSTTRLSMSLGLSFSDQKELAERGLKTLLNSMAEQRGFSRDVVMAVWRTTKDLKQTDDALREMTIGARDRLAAVVKGALHANLDDDSD